MNIIEKLVSIQNKLNDCEEGLRELEKVSKIITQDVDIAVYMHTHTAQEER